LVTLRFFGGMTTTEAAAALGISVPTAERWPTSREKTRNIRDGILGSFPPVGIDLPTGERP
jgi:transposase